MKKMNNMKKVNNMKKMNKIIAVVLCVCLLAGILSGCNNQETFSAQEDSNVPIHAAFVLQPVSTVPKVNVEAAGELLKNVCKIPGSSVSIIVADGVAWEYASVEPDAIDTSLSESMQEQVLNERVQELAVAAGTAVAINPESDLRGAIEMAARNLQSYSDGEKELVIFGSGINTVSPLEMQDMPISTIDVDAVIENLKESSYVVNLEGIDVTFYNLGDTCGEQPALTNRDKESLKTFWTQFLEAGNPDNIQFENDLPSGLVYENLPKMSTVPVIEDGSALEEITEAVQAITFDEETIAFEKGTAVLADSAAAGEAVSQAAQYMIDSDADALLVGSTAHWGEISDSITLSYERARVIKDLFVDAGVDADKLTAIGAGWLSCFYTDDQSADGELDETIAPSNRACTWVNASSGLAERIWEDEDFASFIVED